MKRLTDGLVIRNRARGASPDRRRHLFGWPQVGSSAPPPPPPPPPPGDPNVLVRGNGLDILNGDASPQSTDHTVFVSAMQGAGGTTRTYTIHNTGTAELALSGLTVPTGFTIIDGVAATIAAGASDTIAIRLDDASLGAKSGNVSFATNVPGKNPYVFAISGTVVSASSDWHDWAGDFATLSDTRRNLSGGAKTDAPFSALVTFHPGEVPADTWFQATCNGLALAADRWQIGERGNHPDGSLAFGTLRALVPGSTANLASIQIVLTPVIAARTAETDARAVAVITGSSDMWVELSDITEPENRPNHSFATRRSQQAWVNPTLEYRNNRALALPTAYKRTAGSIFNQWVSFEMLRTPGGATEDTQLWILNVTETWFQPGTNTVVHQSHHPLLMNGFATETGYAKVAKVRLMNGVTQVHNYSDVLTLTMADWNFRSSAGEWEFTDSATDFSTFRFRRGEAVKLAGTLPSPLTAGQIYDVSGSGDTGGYAGSGRAGEITQQPNLGLCHFGVWTGRGGNGAGLFNNLPIGAGGGTHTMTSMTLLIDKCVLALRDDDGCEFWLVGGALIEPYWTRAEKIRRMQTGQIISIPIDEFPENPSTPWLGQASNTPKNTSGIPTHEHLHKYAPGRCLYHRGDQATSGVGFQAGNHLNECSLAFWDCLNDMANPSTNFWRFHRKTAAEAIAFNGINTFSPALVSGARIAKPVILNNGPNDDGVTYTGCGPCFPTTARAGFGVTGAPVYVPGSQSGQYQQNEMNYFSNGGESGSHAGKDFMFSYMLRTLPTDLIATQLRWTLTASQLYDNAHPLYGRNKTHNGVSYRHGGGMLGTSVFVSGRPRDFIAWNYFLSFCLYTPDSDPLSRYFRDVAETNVRYLAAVIDDPTIMGERAKVVGMIQSGTGNQGWVLGRHLLAATYLLKRSGMTGSDAQKVLRYITAMPRMLWGSPEGGGTPWKQATGDGYTGWTGFVLAVKLFDKGLSNNTDPNNTDPRNCTVRFLDDASSVTDGSKLMLGHDGTSNVCVTFNTNNTITWSPSQKFNATHMPIAGDEVNFSRDPLTTQPPASVPEGTPLWCYEFTGSTCKISTTDPALGPPTQLTWSIGGPIAVHVNNIVMDLKTRRAGAYPNGLVGIMQNTGEAALEYLYEFFGAVPAAETMFGADFLDDVITKHDTFRTRSADPAQGGHKYYNRAWSSMSWAMIEHYGPGAT